MAADQQPPPTAPTDDPLEGRRPWIRVDDARITEAKGGPQGRWDVTISGHNLKMAVSPPRITVGGVPLMRPVFEPSGKLITGTLTEEPATDEVVVDYGFATGATKVTRSG